MLFTSFEDTIVAPATIPGTGAITIIRVSGPDTFAIVDKVVDFKSGTAASAKANTIKYGTVTLEDGSPLDEVLVSVFRAPHSYTGEDSAEISCHASPFVASELIRLLCDAGARPANPGEYTRRAFVNGKMDLAQAEAVADVISSTNESSLRIAMNQLRGGYSSDLKKLREKLLEISSLLELELDFSEEEVEFADRGELTSLLDEALLKIHSLTDSFRYGNALRNGVPVAIVGAVNAGKSTLLNALLGDERAIVSDIAGTTRDTVEETFVIDGCLFRLIDTAGLRESVDLVEKIGIERSYKKLSEASIVLAVLDITADEAANDSAVEDIVSRIDPMRQKIIFLLNKADILAPNINVSILNNSVSSTEGKAIKLYISAKTGFGLDSLRERLIDCQKSLMPDTEDTIVTNARHYAALREASSSLEAAKQSLIAKRSNDLIAEDLRQANHHLGTIFGEVTPDEVLGRIFERYCVGK